MHFQLIKIKKKHVWNNVCQQSLVILYNSYTYSTYDLSCKERNTSRRVYSELWNLFHLTLPVRKQPIYLHFLIPLRDYFISWFSMILFSTLLLVRRGQLFKFSFVISKIYNFSTVLTKNDCEKFCPILWEFHDLEARKNFKKMKRWN